MQIPTPEPVKTVEIALEKPKIKEEIVLKTLQTDQNSILPLLKNKNCCNSCQSNQFIGR